MALNKNWKHFALVNMGLFLTAFGLVNFLVPAKLAAGGVSGLATIINYYFNYSVGLTIFFLNIPILIMGIFTFGKKYASKSLYGIFALSIFIGVIERFLVIPYFASLSSRNPFIGSCLGGLVIGLGLGFALGLGSNTGGTAIVAQILNHKFDIKIGTSLMMADALVIGLAAIAFGVKSALLAGVSLIFMGQVINRVDKKIKERIRI